ncbi:hypothetical protein CsatB_007464 [Cannabis sativa]
MVIVVRTTLNPKTTTATGGGRPQNPTKHPLLPTEPDNGLAPARRPKTREVTSRYMSSSTSSSSTSSSALSTSFSSRRCPSPMISRASNSTASITPMPTTKRAQFVERRRTATLRPSSLELRHFGGGGVGSEMTAVQKLLFTSTRSLSVSFQGESFSFPVSNVKHVPSPSVRKGTLERRMARTTPGRGDHRENSKPIEPQRWPGKLRQPDCMDRILDFNDERRSTGGFCGSVLRNFPNSMVDIIDRTSVNRRLSSASSNAELLKTAEAAVEVNSIGSDAICDNVASSDSENVSSSCTTPRTLEFGAFVCQEQRGSRGAMAAARFWQESKNRSQRLPEPASPFSRSTAMRAFAPSKLITTKKLSIESPVLSPRGVLSSSRRKTSPIKGICRPASPSKASMSVVSSTLRGTSPLQIRNLVPGTMSNKNAPSILSFAVDIQRGKAGENRLLDAHFLRLLYNRLLQWRFINARVDASLSAQRLNAEMVYLEEWSVLDWDYTCSLSGAFEALKASTLRLLVVAGARADVQNVKDAICSAVDVMQAMASSICLLTSKDGEVNSLVGEVSTVTAKERALLGHCKDLLSTVAALQMVYLEEWSVLDWDYTCSLSGAFEALKASTLRLLVVAGARADVQNGKDAICSAVDVMQAMASSICLLTSKDGEVNSLVGEVSTVTAKERALLGHCKDLLSTVAALQMVYLEEWSVLDWDYTCSLSRSFEALKASTLRLLVVAGARDGEVNSLVGEVSTVTAKERALLGHCKDLLSTVAALQMVYLEEWSVLDWDYTCSLSGAFEALKASTLRLLVVAGARADVQNVKDAICSAVDVMQAMASSICLLTSKDGEVNSLVREVSTVTAKERALLGHCKDLLSTVAALQFLHLFSSFG